MKVKVKDSHSVDYNKKIYMPGDEIDLPDKSAQRLIDKDVVEPVSKIIEAEKRRKGLTSEPATRNP